MCSARLYGSKTFCVFFFFCFFPLFPFFSLPWPRACPPRRGGGREGPGRFPPLFPGVAGSGALSPPELRAAAGEGAEALSRGTGSSPGRPGRCPPRRTRGGRSGTPLEAPELFSAASFVRSAPQEGLGVCLEVGDRLGPDVSYSASCKAMIKSLKLCFGCARRWRTWFVLLFCAGASSSLACRGLCLRISQQ